MKAYEQIIDFMAQQEEGAVVNRKEVQAALGIPKRTMKWASGKLRERRDTNFEVVDTREGVVFRKLAPPKVAPLEEVAPQKVAPLAKTCTPEVAPPEKMAPLELEVGTPLEELAECISIQLKELETQGVRSISVRKLKENLGDITPKENILGEMSLNRKTFQRAQALALASSNWTLTGRSLVLKDAAYFGF